jgi:RAB protein geranylgeranyltransferase component A
LILIEGLFTKGSLIELLISSDVSKYCEFRMVTQILTLNKAGELEKVPTSRSEVFKTNQLSMIEKRLMMKFIQACMKDNTFNELIGDGIQIEQMSFKEFIQAKKLPESISNYLINSVAMCPDKSALEVIKNFLKLSKINLSSNFEL